MSEEVSQKIEKFFSQYQLRKYKKGQVLILSDEITDYVFHIVKGKVKKYDVSYRGEEVIVNIFKSPAFFPMSEAINKTPNHYIYEADTDIEIHQAPADEAVEFIKNNPDVMFDLLSRIYRGMDGLLGRMTHLMSGSAKSLLMHELLLEARRFGQQEKDGRTTLPLSEKDLAARTGLTRETVSREIRKLIIDKLLEVHTKEIIIPNLQEFEAKLNKTV